MTRESIHAGETVREDLDALGMGAAELARRVEEPVNRTSEIVIGRRAWGLLWDDGDRTRGADARPSSTRQRLQESFARADVGGQRNCAVMVNDDKQGHAYAGVVSNPLALCLRDKSNWNKGDLHCRKIFRIIIDLSIYYNAIVITSWLW